MGFESSLSEEEQVDSHDTFYQEVLKVSFGSPIYYRMERTPSVSPIVPMRCVVSSVLQVHFSSSASCYHSSFDGGGAGDLLQTDFRRL